MTEEQKKHLNRPGRHFEFNDKVTYIEKQEITIQPGATFHNGPAPEPGKTSRTVVEKTNNQDDEIMMILDDLLDEADDKGNPLFTEQVQWYAVYRVLKEKVNCPEKMSGFQRYMDNLGYNNARVRCTYPSLKQGSIEFTLLSVKVDLWKDYRNVSEK